MTDTPPPDSVPVDRRAAPRLDADVERVALERDQLRTRRLGMFRELSMIVVVLIALVVALGWRNDAADNGDKLVEVSGDVSRLVARVDDLTAELEAARAQLATRDEDEEAIEACLAAFGRLETRASHELEAQVAALVVDLARHPIGHPDREDVVEFRVDEIAREQREYEDAVEQLERWSPDPQLPCPLETQP